MQLLMNLKILGFSWKNNIYGKIQLILIGIKNMCFKNSQLNLKKKEINSKIIAKSNNIIKHMNKTVILFLIIFHIITFLTLNNLR